MPTRCPSTLMYPATSTLPPLGINLSFSRLGSVLNDIASPWMYERQKGAVHGMGGVTAALFLGLLLCLFSCGCAVLLLFIGNTSTSYANRSRNGSGGGSQLSTPKQVPRHLMKKVGPQFANATPKTQRQQLSLLNRSSQVRQGVESSRVNSQTLSALRFFGDN